MGCILFSMLLGGYVIVLHSIWDGTKVTMLDLLKKLPKGSSYVNGDEIFKGRQSS